MHPVFNILEIDGELMLRSANGAEFRSYLAGLLRGASFDREAADQLFADLPRMHTMHGSCSFNLPDGREVRLRKEQV